MFHVNADDGRTQMLRLSADDVAALAGLVSGAIARAGRALPAGVERHWLSKCTTKPAMASCVPMSAAA